MQMQVINIIENYQSEIIIYNYTYSKHFGNLEKFDEYKFCELNV